MRRQLQQGNAVAPASSSLDLIAAKLLKWNVARDLSGGKADQTANNELLHSLPESFSTISQYIDIWEPLLIREIQANAISDRNASSVEPYWGQCTIDPIITAEKSPVRHLQITCDTKSTHSISGTPGSLDLIIVTHKQSDIEFLRSRSAPSSSSSRRDVSLAVGLLVQVDPRKRHGELLLLDADYRRLLLEMAAEVKPDMAISSTKVRGTDAASVIGRKQTPITNKPFTGFYQLLGNIRSYWREYRALRDFRFAPLYNAVLGNGLSNQASPPTSSVDSPVPTSSTTSTVEPGSPRRNAQHDFPLALEVELAQSWKATRKFMAILKQRFNPSQLCAMHKAVTAKDIALIQGPPGTGKTKTILGLLNGIHLKEYNTYYEHLLTLFLSRDGIQQTKLPGEHNWLELMAHAAKAKPRILVVAPSNVAVDHILERVMEEGFRDGHGSTYRPSVLRVGALTRNSRQTRASVLDQVSLATFMEKQLAVDVTKEVRRERLTELQLRITRCIAEARAVQALLINLRIGFHQCEKLPAGWEMRVSLETGLPYWLDHNLATTTTQPPIAESAAAIAFAPYCTVESLPDYEKHAHHFTQLLSSMDSLRVQKSRLDAILSAQAQKGTSDIPQAVREMIEVSVIQEAHILFTTLNSCGHPSLESAEFCVVVIDEAAQCTEPSVLIPLRHGCHKCVLVGDQDQLSATVFSEVAKAHGYERSLFQRLIDAGHSYVMLNTQYRMRPEISGFPALTFYDNELKNGENVCQISYTMPYLRACKDLTLVPSTVGIGRVSGGGGQMLVPYVPVFNNFMFFDLQYSRDSSSSSAAAGRCDDNDSIAPGNTQSKVNSLEAKFCVRLLEALVTDIEYLQQLHANIVMATGQQMASALPFLGTVGVITPYSEQLAELRRRCHASLVLRDRPEYRDRIELNTVDGFQGREKDIVIISTVRANDEGDIGFLSNRRRMNVAITRAKYGLFVVGNLETLSRHGLWNRFVNYSRRLNAVVSLPHALDHMSAHELSQQSQPRERLQMERHNALLFHAHLVEYQRHCGVMLPMEYSIAPLELQPTLRAELRASVAGDTQQSQLPQYLERPLELDGQYGQQRSGKRRGFRGRDMDDGFGAKRPRGAVGAVSLVQGVDKEGFVTEDLEEGEC